MIRIVLALLLSLIPPGLSLISYGFGDLACTFETWLGAFILPLWSLAVVSLWHDIGRIVWCDVFKLDSPHSLVSNDIRSFVFILWMSVVLTYLFLVHSSFFAIPLLIVLPFLGVPFRDFLLHDWTIIPKFTAEQYLAFAFWLSSSYLVYWITTITWILVRVWFVDLIEGGVVFFIR